jgi:NADPH-dependent 2,4-dienoyl-CoA reductase/sulfur reductase-like enzyme
MSAAPIALVASFVAACILIRVSRPFQYPRRTIREMYLVAAGLSAVGAVVLWAHLVAGLIVWGVTLPFFYVLYGVSPRGYRNGAKYRDRKPCFDTQTRIAVLGAGASGLAAAEELRELGYENVTIIEAGAEAGGKTREHEVQGIRYETGTVWCFPGPDYERYCNKYGLTAPDLLSGVLAPVQRVEIRCGRRMIARAKQVAPDVA